MKSDARLQDYPHDDMLASKLVCVYVCVCVYKSVNTAIFIVVAATVLCTAIRKDPGLALMEASYQGRHEAAKLLLEYGADMNNHRGVCGGWVDGWVCMCLRMNVSLFFIIIVMIVEIK